MVLAELSDQTRYRRSRSPSRLQKTVPKTSYTRPLDLEERSNDTLLPLSANFPTRFHILRIVGRNDILARLRVIHNRFGMRSEAIEAPVEDPRGNEGVYIPDVEPATKLI